jgi:hypothetical protein
MQTLLELAANSTAVPTMTPPANSKYCITDDDILTGEARTE